MQTLTWQNGQCTNPPPAWEVEVSTHFGRWEFAAIRTKLDVFRRPVVTAQYTDTGYPTERAAQLACEAFLWCNGALALPEWPAVGAIRSLSVGACRASLALRRPTA
jgi:hypothetical protein